MKTTFVTAFMTIYDKPYQNKDITWRFTHFKRLCETGIPLAVFCSRDVVQQFEEEILQKYSNVVLLEPLDLRDTWTYQTYEKVVSDGLQINLPNTRTTDKDTIEYLLLMNAKTELIIRAIIKNPYKSTHYAWIDFNIFHIFTHNNQISGQTCIDDADKASNILQTISRENLSTRFLTLPGCWGKELVVEDRLLNDICWRFCGGFFIGSRDRMFEFHKDYEVHFETFLRTYRKLVWEVNFWAYLELKHGLSVIWYLGDHNPSILKFDAEYVATRLNTKRSCSHQKYDYPDQGDYIPTSTSYVCHKGNHIINTRYVNYWLWPNGGYLIKDPDNYIRTRNFSSILEDGKPANFREMIVEGLPCYGGSIYGLEDIRLYTRADGELGFIATSINHSGVGRNRMVIGLYDIGGGGVLNCSVLIPPERDSWCEKNWIPIVKGGVEYFIYSWQPFQMGILQYVAGERKQLVITRTWEHSHPMFSNIRGSTPFVETPEGLLGVVHFSYEGAPRRYFHMLVLLDKEEMLPIRFSNVFVFNKVSIEFCIGFAIRDNQYAFWISNFDRDPEVISIHPDEFVW